MKLSESNIHKLQQMIFSWWDINRRDLPWRHTHDPYKIFVSEVMLQQTQVSRVTPKYESFLTMFPDVGALACATPADILKEWKGMGYNRRALFLQKAARMVVNEFSGIFPDNEKDLRNLPGLGIYTARAVLVFAYKQDIAMVDTNIRQIITHYFFEDAIQKESVIQEVATQILPTGKSWEWHQALMDFGALALRRIPDKQRSSKPFKETDRYVRGRIVDVLRESAYDHWQLIKQMSDITGRSNEDIGNILQKLLKDELITCKKDIYSLPE